MKQSLLLACCFALLFNHVHAQISINAGADKTVYRGQSVQLAASANSTYPPISVQWAPSTGLSSVNSLQPIATPLSTTTYYLVVTDNVQNTSVDSVTVFVKNKYNLNISAIDTNACTGETLQLTSNMSSNYSTSRCAGSVISSPIGNGNITQPGSGVSYPSLFGNFAKSTRNQMLYTASELQAVLGGPQLIKGLAFNIAFFNSSAQLQNFSIKMGAVVKDSLFEWENNLVQVFGPSTISPVNIVPYACAFNLTTAFYWDGVSDLIVDVSNYNPQTSNSQNNKAECTVTAFNSYLYSYGQNDQRASYYTPTKSNIRPNIKFNTCLPDSPIAIYPLNVTGVNFNWKVIAGNSSISDSSSATPSAMPTENSTYVLDIIDSFGCIESDTITIHVKQNVVTGILSSGRSCIYPATGTIMASLTTDSVDRNYWLTNNYIDTLFSGNINQDTTLTFSSIGYGNYHLLVSDSICSTVDLFTRVDTFQSMILDTIVQNTITCYGGGDGAMCINVTNGTPPYSYFWDSTTILPACRDSLDFRKHYVIVTDSNNCVQRSVNFSIPQPAPITFQLSTNSLINYQQLFPVTISGGTGPYTISWGDSSQTTTTQIDTHYYAPGNYLITITDYNGCEFDSTVGIGQYNSINSETSNLSFIQLYPNPATQKLYLDAKGTTVDFFKIYAPTGQLVYETQLPLNNTIDISHLTSGIYIAEIKTKIGSVMKRWVKM